jgi:signal transduction histidine kinase
MQVKDTGVGIPQADLPRVFMPFHQTAEGKRHVGTGLGMSIAKQLVELMGGEIEVESDVGKGTTFTIDLPWKLPDDVEKI